MSALIVDTDDYHSDARKRTFADHTLHLLGLSSDYVTRMEVEDEATVVVERFIFPFVYYSANGCTQGAVTVRRRHSLNLKADIA